MYKKLKLSSMYILNDGEELCGMRGGGMGGRIRNGMGGYDSSSFCVQHSTNDGVFIKAKIDEGICWSEERVNVRECSWL